jgi:hypothetical protein
MAAGLLLILLGVALVLYFLPTLVAQHRGIRTEWRSRF